METFHDTGTFHLDGRAAPPVILKTDTRGGPRELPDRKFKHHS
nr:MAG TPA: hypothetical protein [Caudoviricetes sp.]